ncbi:hypothetical protein V8G54_030467 [Vigna mungo]|uniref:Uncharacterized protein n=1 Tax=Vigna mungo TaxID=3915 RepID=A0AAQ3MWF5_VIGMU
MLMESDYYHRHHFLHRSHRHQSSPSHFQTHNHRHEHHHYPSHIHTRSQTQNRIHIHIHILCQNQWENDPNLIQTHSRCRVRSPIPSCIPSLHHGQNQCPLWGFRRTVHRRLTCRKGASFRRVRLLLWWKRRKRKEREESA